MSLHIRAALTAALVVVGLLGGVRPVKAQSLVDLAKQEEARRKALKETGKTYTNKDLPHVSAPAPATDAASKTADGAAPDQKPAAGDTAADKGNSAASDAAGQAKDGDKAKDSDKPKDSDKAKDPKYWSDRLKDLRTALDRDQTYADALQSRINALTTDFVNRDDPAQRAVIGQDRQKALDELGRLKLTIENDKKALVDLDEEARRTGVPPGWLR